jgi:hypothetical protein
MYSGAAAGATDGGVYIAVAAGAIVGAVSAAGDLTFTPLRGQLLFPAVPEPLGPISRKLFGVLQLRARGFKIPARFINSMGYQQCGWYSKRSC